MSGSLAVHSSKEKLGKPFGNTNELVNKLNASAAIILECLANVRSLYYQ